MRQRTSPEEEALEELRRLPRFRRRPPRKKKRPPWVRYTAIGLLAVICVGAAELTACRFFAPAIYEKVAEPVREAVHQAVQAAGRDRKSVV